MTSRPIWPGVALLGTIVALIALTFLLMFLAAPIYVVVIPLVLAAVLVLAIRGK